jgi:hypothetical protein
MTLSRPGFFVARLLQALAFLGATAAAAAQGAVVTGTVLDDAGLAVRAARVSLSGSVTIASTDSAGAFRLLATRGEHSIEVRRIGFAVARQGIVVPDAGDPAPLIIRLSVLATALTGVVIPGERTVALGQTVNRATVRNALPLGEADVMRALPFVPGVNMPNELVPRVNLAGAAGDETAITLDGHPLQFPTHMYGFVGAFNVAALERAELLMHHVPATIDTRLGGTLALHSREAAEQGDGEFVVSVLGASTTLGVPLPAIDGDLLVSSRYSYLAHTIKALGGSGDAEGAEFAWPYYGDLLVRLGHRVGPRWRLETMGYYAHDWFDVSGFPGTIGPSISEAMAGTRLVREGPSSRLTVRLSQDLALATKGQGEGTTIRDSEVKQRATSAEVSLDTRHSAAFASTIGISVDDRRHAARWPYRYSDYDTPAAPSVLKYSGSQQLLAIAGETRWTRGETGQSAFGLRLSTAGTSAYLAPRFRTSWRPAPSLRIEAAYDRRYQFDAQIGDPRASVFPPPTFLLRRPRRMDGIATTVEWAPSLPSGRSLALSVTPFARSYVARTKAIDRGFDTTTVTSMEFERIAARGLGVGVGLTYARSGGASLQVAYTATSVHERDGDAWVRSDWSTPHSASALLTLPFLRTWEFTTSLQQQSGPPLTPIDGQLLVPSAGDPNTFFPLPVFGERNSARLPGLRRMDIAIRRSWAVRGAQVTFALQGVNVLFDRNEFEYELRSYQESIEGGFPPYPKRQGFPFVPSFGLEIRW